MYDGAEISKAITDNPGTWKPRSLAYEIDLFPRSASERREADRIQEVLFGGNSPQNLLDFFAANLPVMESGRDCFRSAANLK